MVKANNASWWLTTGSLWLPYLLPAQRKTEKMKKKKYAMAYALYFAHINYIMLDGFAMWSFYEIDLMKKDKIEEEVKKATSHKNVVGIWDGIWQKLTDRHSSRTILSLTSRETVGQKQWMWNITNISKDTTHTHPELDHWRTF